MQTLEYVVLPHEEGVKVKTVLQNRGLSTGMIRRLKQANGIILENQAVTVAKNVSAGQKLVLRLPQTPSEFVKPVPMKISVVYEDDWLLVVHKPSGVPIHPSANHHDDSLAGGVAYYMQQENFVFHPITRLDRYTSGLVLIAKNGVAAADLCGQMKAGKIEKTYYAVTKGVPTLPQGCIECPIGREEGSVIKRRVSEKGKPAVTHYWVEQTRNNTALVKVMPVTGRTHQIRVHLSHIGTPLLYDFLYRQEVENKIFLLQCVELKGIHPKTKKEFCVKIPCDIW